MKKNPTTIVALNGGEISPRVLSRIDMQGYQSAASTSDNWIPLRQGGIAKRSGSQFLGDAFNSNLNFRFFRYKTGPDDSDIIIELCGGRLRFWFNGALVQSGGSDYEIFVPFSGSVVQQVRYAQKNNQFVLSHESEPTIIFTVSAPNDITSEQIPFTNVPERYFIDDKSPPSVDGVFEIEFNGTWTAGDTFYSRQNNVTPTTFIQKNFTEGSTGVGGSFEIFGLSGAALSSRGERLTYIYTNNTSAMEARIRRMIEDGPFVGKGDCSVTFQGGTTYEVEITGASRDLSWTAFPDDVEDQTAKITVLTTESGQAGLEPAWSYPQVVTFGGDWYQCENPVKSSTDPSSDTANWTELGSEPDWESWQPSRAWVANKPYGPWGRGFPAIATFYQQRLVLARSTDARQAIYGSRISVYDDFRIGLNENEGYSFDLDTDEEVTIQWLQGNLGLTVGTTGGDFTVNSGGSLVSSINPLARRETARKSRFRESVMIGQDILYVEQGGQKLRRLLRTVQTESYDSADVSWLADHLSERRINRVVVMNTPETLIWMAMDDGSLVGLMYLPESDQLAWWQNTIDGEVIDIMTGYSVLVDEDVLYMAVNRPDPNSPEVDKLLIERMLYPKSNRIAMDSWVSGSADQDADPNTTTIDGLDHLEGHLVTVLGKKPGAPGLSRFYYVGEYTVESGRVIADGQLAFWRVGLNYVATHITNELVGDGSWIVTKRRWTQLFVRLLNSWKPLIDGDRVSGRAVDTLMDTGANPTTGDYMVHTMGNATRGKVTIVQDQPFPTEVTSLYGQVEIAND